MHATSRMTAARPAATVRGHVADPTGLARRSAASLPHEVLGRHGLDCLRLSGRQRVPRSPGHDHAGAGRLGRPRGLCRGAARRGPAGAGIVAALGRAAEQFPSDDWQTDVDRLIDHLADLWRSEPGRRHVWLAMQSTALTRSLAAEQTTRIAEQIVPLVAWLMPEGSRRRARTVAAVVVQMCYSLLHFSVHDDRPHPATVRELKRALRSYLRAVALDAQG